MAEQTSTEVSRGRFENLARIKRNVQKMADQNAPMEDIDGYIASEGVTVEDVRDFNPDPYMQGQGVTGTVGDFLSRANDEFLFGAGEEYRAGMKSIPALMPGGESFGDAYKRNLDVENARRGRIQRERPMVDLAGRTAGLGAQVLTGTELARAGMLPGMAQTATGRIMQAGGSGAVVGGISAAADTESDLPLGERTLRGTAVGAGVGAGIGGAVEAIPPLMRGASKLLGHGSDTKRAVERIASRIRAQEADPAAIAAAKRRATQVGADDYALIDYGGRNGNAGTQLQRLGRNVADQPGKGSAMLDDFVQGRQSGQYGRYTNAVERNVAPVKPIDDLRDALRQRAQEIVRPIYRKGAADRVPISGAMRVDLAKPSIRQAWKEAQRIAAEWGEQLDPLIVDGKVNGQIKDVSANTLHRLREGMDDLISKQTTVNPNSTKDLSKLGAAYSSTRKIIDKALKGNSAAYREADQIFSTFKNYEFALRNGANYGRKTPDQLASSISRMSPKAKAMHRLGAAWRMANDLGKLRDGRDVAKAFMASPAERQRLQALLGGDERRLRDMIDYLAAEKEMSTSFAKVTGGSRTSAQQADMAAEGMRKAGQMLRKGALQNVWDAMGGIVERMGRMGEGEREEIARILTETDPQAFDAYMRQLTEAIGQQQNRAITQGAIEQIGVLEGARQ